MDPRYWLMFTPVAMGIVLLIITLKMTKKDKPQRLTKRKK